MKKILILILLSFAVLTACDSDGESVTDRVEFWVSGLNGAYLANIEYVTPSGTLTLANNVLDWYKIEYSLEEGTYKICATNLSGSGEIEILVSTEYVIYRKQSATTACITFTK